VIEARGAAHHYGNANQVWIVTTARVAPAARDEAAAEHALPCALFAGADLARVMERLGIGLRSQTIVLSDIDFDLLEALGDGGLRRERERARDRDRDEQRSRDNERRRGPSPEGEGEREEGGEARDIVAPEIDLLDAEAAEASRLSGAPDDAAWQEGGEASQGEAGEEESSAAEEQDVELDLDRDDGSEELEVEDGPANDDEDGGDQDDEDERRDR
jgi:hypothetical protein